VFSVYASWSRVSPSQKCEAVPRRARISGSQTFVSPNSRLESHKEAEEVQGYNKEEEERSNPDFSDPKNPGNSWITRPPV